MQDSELGKSERDTSAGAAVTQLLVEKASSSRAPGIEGHPAKNSPVAFALNTRCTCTKCGTSSGAEAASGFADHRTSRCPSHGSLEACRYHCTEQSSEDRGFQPPESAQGRARQMGSLLLPVAEHQESGALKGARRPKLTLSLQASAVSRCEGWTWLSLRFWTSLMLLVRTGTDMPCALWACLQLRKLRCRQCIACATGPSVGSRSEIEQGWYSWPHRRTGIAVAGKRIQKGCDVHRSGDYLNEVQAGAWGGKSTCCATNSSFSWFVRNPKAQHDSWNAFPADAAPAWQDPVYCELAWLLVPSCVEFPDVMASSDSSCSTWRHSQGVFDSRDEFWTVMEPWLS